MKSHRKRIVAVVGMTVFAAAVVAAEGRAP